MALGQKEGTPAMTGSCQCGAVTFKCTSVPTHMSNCYCRCCTKVHGAPFACYADVPTADLTWSGDIATYQASSRAIRSYCANCASPVSMVYNDEAESTGLPAPLIDLNSLASQLPKVSQHIFVSEKVPWYDIPNDGIPQFKTFTDEWKQRFSWARDS